jgi:signal transduction histidine kinase
MGAGDRMPNTSRSELEAMARRYAECLAAYVRAPHESTLEPAYNLGRLGISLGLGVLDVAVLHRRAQEGVLRGSDSLEACAAESVRASEFFAECLATFEILHRGYRESALQLHKLNVALKQRATELAEAKELIERLSRARTAFLSEASRRLAATLDFDAALMVAASLAVPSIADWSAVDLADEGGAARRAAISHLPRLPEGCLPSQHAGPVPSAAAVVERVLQSGISEMVGSGSGSGDEKGEAMVVALAARGRTMGALTLSSSRGARFGEEELLLAEELARRASMALDNARLYREAQQAVRVRDEFLSVASHELRTPLTPLTLRLHSMARRAREGRPVDLHATESAVRHVQRMTELVDDLLDVSRIEAGKLELRRAPLPLVPLVRELVYTFSQSLPDRVLHFDPSESPVVFADRARIEQVVTNLLDNALKYSPAGGEVRVELEQSGGEAVLSIADSGIGIPPDLQKRLFQRYFRAPNAKQTTWGLGLGLFICRDIVERHGGRIWVQSEEEKGATFFVALPLVALPPIEASDPH